MSTLRPGFVASRVALIGLAAALVGCAAKDKEAKRPDPHEDDHVAWADADGTADDKYKESRSQHRGGGRIVNDEGGSQSGRPAHVTFPGFRMFEDGGSRVFVEVSGKVPIKEMKADGRLIYRISNVNVPEKVNRLDLPTLHFATPVARVRMKKVDDGAELIIDLRQKTQSKTHLKATSHGTVLSVDFPKLRQTEGRATGKVGRLSQPAKKNK